MNKYNFDKYKYLFAISKNDYRAIFFLMILFNLMSIQFMADNDTINWNEKTITIRDNIKFI